MFALSSVLSPSLRLAVGSVQSIPIGYPQRDSFWKPIFAIVRLNALATSPQVAPGRIVLSAASGPATSASYMRLTGPEPFQW